MFTTLRTAAAFHALASRDRPFCHPDVQPFAQILLDGKARTTRRRGVMPALIAATAATQAAVDSIGGHVTRTRARR